MRTALPLMNDKSFIMMKTLSLHMQANNGVSTNMGIVYVAPVQNKAGIHFMVNLSDQEVQCHNNKNSY
jgi:N-acetylmuramoyl-L-alanine amidase CwlA